MSADALFARLARSDFRRRFRLGVKERAHLAAEGPATIRSHAEDFIAARLAPAQPKNDGRQTPMRGHPVFVAQHATASCGRSCLSKWHGIPPGWALTQTEQARIVESLMRWIEAADANVEPSCRNCR